MTKKTEQQAIQVYADWAGLVGPSLIGVLYSETVRGKEIFSFEYDRKWLESAKAQNLDPDLLLFSGTQYLSEGKTNFGIFLDSSPDRWGRVLMDRREAVIARMEDRKPRTLFETDYLLGVYDGHRMGALRFRESEDAPFLNNNKEMSSPPWTSIRELERAGLQLEQDGDDKEKLKWLNLLLAPGSSLGGARPKASVLDEKGQLWIAKFPSTKDGYDVGGWEKVVHELALKSGLFVPEAMANTFYSKQHTFLTKRFDRTAEGQRIHFASAMTLLGHVDGTNHQAGVSYLDLAMFIMKNGAAVEKDLEELWRRIVFYICVSNADDHLRNHGFLLTDGGWILSPAYDVNPVEKATGLSLNISETDNALELDLALEVAQYFRVTTSKAKSIITTVKKAVANWNKTAEQCGLPRSERDLMARAFMQAE
jgi:serine/threonine-protein kinase HipA